MDIPFFQVDAFSSEVFRGNPAGVCLLRAWLPDATLQAIAAENNLSETAFLVPQNGDFEIRWFTPQVEVDLCGHATLASAHVVFSQGITPNSTIRFHSPSGLLEVSRDGDLLAMDFPSRPAKPGRPNDTLLAALGVSPLEVYWARDAMMVLRDEFEVRQIQPDMTALMQLDCLGVIVTAKGERVDFVSRFFGPKVGIPEDPVTGSAHCTLIPYWSKKLGKKQLHAHQISARGGELFCHDLGERVRIAGKAVTYLRGMLLLD